MALGRRGEKADRAWDRERRISLISMLPTDARFKERGIKLRGIMKKTGPLFDPPLEYSEIPFEGTVLPGYFRKAAAGKTPAKVTVPALIIVGEGEYRSAEVQRHQKVARTASPTRRRRWSSPHLMKARRTTA